MHATPSSRSPTAWPKPGERPRGRRGGRTGVPSRAQSGTARETSRSCIGTRQRSKNVKPPHGRASSRSHCAIRSSSALSASRVSAGAFGSQSFLAASMRRDRCAIRFEVDTRDKPVTEQEWQHVIAVHSPWRRSVDLDPVPDSRTNAPFCDRSQTSGSNGASECASPYLSRYTRILMNIAERFDPSMLARPEYSLFHHLE